MVVCPEGEEASWVSPKERLCSAWPTAGALKSVFQQPAGTEGAGSWAPAGVGAAAPPAGLSLGGLLPEGPCGSPPNTKEAAAAGLK